MLRTNLISEPIPQGLRPATSVENRLKPNTGSYGVAQQKKHYFWQKLIIMGDTYVQAYFHLVFAVRNRKALIHSSWKDRIEKYITGIVQNYGHKLIAIGAERDHVHLFIGYNLNQKIPDLVEKIKTSSNLLIKKERLSYYPFSWQNGYGAFTHSHSNLSAVANYVLNQEEHHRKTSFREEYIKMLEDFEVAYKPNYLFEFFDDLVGEE